MPTYHKRVLIVGIIAVVAIAAILVIGRLVETRINPEAALKPGERIENDGTGKQIKSVMFEADVLSWNPAEGVLAISRDGKKQEVKIVLPQTVLLIATAGAGGRSGMLTPVRSKEEELWRTAFCPGNKVTIALPSGGGNQAVNAFNFGFYSFLPTWLPRHLQTLRDYLRTHAEQPNGGGPGGS